MDRPARITFAGLVWVILTTGLLATLLGAVLKGGVRERARRSGCASSLHHLTLAMVQYTNDWDGLFPAVPGVRPATKNSPGLAPPGSGEESLGLLFDVYIPEIRCFWCPSAPPGEADRIGYYPYSSSPAASGGRSPFFREHDLPSFAYDPRPHAADKPGGALVADRGGGKGVNSPNHQFDGQNVLFLDGHVKWETQTDCGYGGARWGGGPGGDEIYVRNDELANPREDTWLTNSKGPSPEEALRVWKARRRRIFSLLIVTIAAAVLPPAVFLIARGVRRRRNGGNHLDTKSTKEP